MEAAHSLNNPKSRCCFINGGVSTRWTTPPGSFPVSGQHHWLAHVRAAAYDCAATCCRMKNCQPRSRSRARRGVHRHKNGALAIGGCCNAKLLTLCTGQLSSPVMKGTPEPPKLFYVLLLSLMEWRPADERVQAAFEKLLWRGLLEAMRKPGLRWPLTQAQDCALVCPRAGSSRELWRRANKGETAPRGDWKELRRQARLRRTILCRCYWNDCTCVWRRGIIKELRPTALQEVDSSAEGKRPGHVRRPNHD